MNQVDREVLQTIARLSRGALIEIPPATESQPSAKVRELGGGWLLRDRVPALLVTLEFWNAPYTGEVGGALSALQGRGLVESSPDTLVLPDVECRYLCGDGSVWYLACRKIVGNPNGYDGQPEYRARKDTDRHSALSGLAYMLWFRLTAKGWEAADADVDPDSSLKKQRGRPKGSRQPDELDRFVKRVAKRYADEGTRIPVKALVEQFRNESGKTVTYGMMRGRVRSALGRV